jgi:hypothetical protein
MINDIQVQPVGQAQPVGRAGRKRAPGADLELAHNPGGPDSVSAVAVLSQP